MIREDLRNVAIIAHVDHGKTCLLYTSCYADNRLGELHGFQNNGVLFIAKSVAGSGVFKTYRCANVSGVNFRDIFSVVGVHTKDTTESFLVSFYGVKDGRACRNGTGIYAEEDVYKRQTPTR